jgi:hypothetical protein
LMRMFVLVERIVLFMNSPDTLPIGV